MIKKYIFGEPFDTESVVVDLPCEAGIPEVGKIYTENGFTFTYQMKEKELVYGLGEANRGINKRGFIYTSSAWDEPNHTEDKNSLYAAHNFIVVFGEGQAFGLYIDYPGVLSFDIGYTRQDQLKISCEEADLVFYVLTGETPYDIVKDFRKIIGRSYIPPKFAFGMGQCRWSYMNDGEIRDVVDGYRKNDIPLDMVYMDIDYMQDYKDFTVNPERFPDFAEFVNEMKEKHIHLVPIIDAGVKVEKDYSVYEEGVQNGFFCKREDGSDFEAVVWPGWTHFPDVLNADAREWFGNWYHTLLDQGIDAFWNDMNEPATFYTREGLNETEELMKKYFAGEATIEEVRDKVGGIANRVEDRNYFYHNVNGKKVRHDKVHNLFGYNMTRAAGEAFTRLVPDKRILMFSRSSYIGMHRYGGIWTGDNKSWWSHILLNLKMMPSLNMCGFLYCGADLGGFGCDTTRDLVLRWTALGVFTPLMRNHSAWGTRAQEPYNFENIEDFGSVIGVRYRLLPYIYSEYMKAALNDDMYFKPLTFVYPDDEQVREVEDQMMIGNEIMIAPVYTQNATGRYVYLPEEMMFVKFDPEGKISTEVLPAGHHYVKVALNEVPLFIRKGCAIPVADVANHVDAVDYSTIQMVGYTDAKYDLYNDDGVTPIK